MGEALLRRAGGLPWPRSPLTLVPRSQPTPAPGGAPGLCCQLAARAPSLKPSAAAEEALQGKLGRWSPALRAARAFCVPLGAPPLPAAGRTPRRVSRGSARARTGTAASASLVLTRGSSRRTGLGCKRSLGLGCPKQGHTARGSRAPRGRKASRRIPPLAKGPRGLGRHRGKRKSGRHARARTWRRAWLRSCARALRLQVGQGQCRQCQGRSRTSQPFPPHRRSSTCSTQGLPKAKC